MVTVLPRRTGSRDVLVGGVNSPVRAFRQIGAAPVVLMRGRGAQVVDTGGRRYDDFIMGWGCLILGHNHPVVRRAIAQGLQRGTVLGLTHPDERELATLITQSVPSVEQVRFTASGTEACMTAVRLARAVTGRPYVLVFEGGYHGHSDSLLAHQTAGIPELIERQTIRVPYGDRDALEDAVARHAASLACVIIEPVAANMGVVIPERAFLQRVRELTRQHGMVLIFDEVVTGFRVALGGAQEAFGVTPDLTTFGKIIGGGLPIGAVGGPRTMMSRLVPEGDVYHAGTFAGHPLAMAAGIAALRALRRESPYAGLQARTETLAQGLERGAASAGVPVTVNRMASMLTVFFTPGPVRTAAQAKSSRREMFAAWANGLRDAGILVPPSPWEAMFLSTAHGVASVERMVAASAGVWRRAAREHRR